MPVVSLFLYTGGLLGPARRPRNETNGAEDGAELVYTSADIHKGVVTRRSAHGSARVVRQKRDVELDRLLAYAERIVEARLEPLRRESGPHQQKTLRALGSGFGGCGLHKRPGGAAEVCLQATRRVAPDLAEPALVLTVVLVELACAHRLVGLRATRDVQIDAASIEQPDKVNDMRRGVVLGTGA